MEIQTTKIELLKLILSIDNPAVLQKIKTFLLDESEGYLMPLTNVERQEIELGIEQLERGERIAFSEFLAKVK